MPESRSINSIDKINEILLVILIIFSPIFYGSVGLLHYTINGLIILAIVLLTLLKMTILGRFSILKSFLYIPALIFISVVLLQLINLPPSILRIISPHSLGIRTDFISAEFGSGALLPISVSPEHTLLELFKIIGYFAIFFVVINMVESKRQFQRLFSIVILSGLIISIIGVMQKYNLSYPERANWGIAASGGSSFGPFFNRNHFAGYLEMVIPLTLGYLLTDVELNKKIFYGLIGGIMSLALFFSLSRSGILIFIATLLFIAVFSAQKKKLRNATASILFLFAAVLFASFFLLDVDLIADRFRSTFVENQNIFFFMRGYHWGDILKIWRDFPIFGSGLGTFGSLSAKYKSVFSQAKFTYAHNDYLQLLAETGIFGFLSVFLFFIFYFRSLLTIWLMRRNRYVLGMVLGGVSSIWAILLHSLVDFNLHIPSNGLLFFIILGLTYRLAFTKFDKENAVSGSL